MKVRVHFCIHFVNKKPINYLHEYRSGSSLQTGKKLLICPTLLP